MEERGDIEFLRGSGIAKKHISPQGRTPCIHYGELYTLYEPVIHEVVSRTNEIGRVKSVAGDVLIPATTTADAIGIAIARSLNQDDVIIGGDINILRTRNKVLLADFAAQLISTELKTQLAQYAKGTNILHLSNKDIKRLRFPLPSIEIQKKIITEIESYQKIIDGARQIIDNWKPSINVKLEWPLVQLGELCEIFNGSTPSRRNGKYWENGCVPWFTIQDMRARGRIITKTDQQITESALRECSLKLLPPKTTLICCTASVGEYAFTEMELATNQQFNGLIIKKDKKNLLDPKFIYYLASSFKQALLNLSGKTSIDFVSIKKLKSLKIPLPPLEMQKQIVAEIDKEEIVVDSCRGLVNHTQLKIQQCISSIYQ